MPFGRQAWERSPWKPGKWALAPFGEEFHCLVPWTWLEIGTQHRISTRWAYPIGPVDPSLCGEWVNYRRIQIEALKRWGQRVRVALPQANIQHTLYKDLTFPLTTGSRIISLKISLIRMSYQRKKLSGKSQVTKLFHGMLHKVSDLRCFWASTLIPRKPKALFSYFPRKVIYWMLDAGEVRTHRESQPKGSRWVSKVSILFCCPSPLMTLPSLLCHLLCMANVPG